MKLKILGLVLVVCIFFGGAGEAQAATGDVTASVTANGWYLLVNVAGFTRGGTYVSGLGTLNAPGVGTPYCTITSAGYDNGHSVTSVTRTGYWLPQTLTTTMRFPYGTFYIGGGTFGGTGTFLDGELVTEAVTGATGRVVGNQSSGTRLYMTNRSATAFSGVNACTSTSGATFAATTADTAVATTVNYELVGSAGLTVRIPLSQWVYQGETITMTVPAGWLTDNGSGGTGLPNNVATTVSVTNNSTLAYSTAKVIGHFVSPQRLAVNASTTIEVFAVQTYGRNGSPVADVVVTATGATSTHTESGHANVMTLSTRGDSIPVYAVTLPLTVAAGFTRGELVNINFTAYPWVGDSTSVLDATADAGSLIFQLGPLKYTIMDKMIAVVDGIGAGTPTASTSQATADANPFATWATARTGIAAANAALGVTSRLDGGEVQLKAGTYTYAPNGSSTINGAFTTTHHSSTNRAGVILAQSSADYQYAYMRLYDITITRASNTFIFFAANTNVLLLDKVNFNDTHTGWYSGDTNSDIEFFDCTSNDGWFSPGGNDGHSRIIRNMAYTPTTEASGGPGANASIILGFHVSGGTRGLWGPIGSSSSNNCVVGYSYYYAADSTSPSLIGNSDLYGLTNCAFVENVLERLGTGVSEVIDISSADCTNLVFWHNSTAGQRFNHENDISGVGATNFHFVGWSGKFNSWDARGDHRADITDTNGLITGTWSVDNSTGWSDNLNEGISYNGDQDFWGIRSNFTAGSNHITPALLAGYVLDASNSGTNAGNGDYHPAAGSPLLNRVPSGAAVVPYDLSGRAIPNDGTGAIGAFQPLGGTNYPGFWY